MGLCLSVSLLRVFTLLFFSSNMFLSKVRKEREELPLVADFTLGLSQMQAAGKDGAQPRRPAPKPNEFYKISLCKHFMSGECPFGDGCHFAHGEAELRKFPRQELKQTEATELGDNLFANQDHVTVDYFQGGVAGGGLPSPILEPDQAHFFIIVAAAQRDLAHSTVQEKWFVQRRDAGMFNSGTLCRGSFMLFGMVH